jgi:hypothetical protein
VVHVEPDDLHVPVPEELGAVVDEHRQRVGLLARRTAGGENAQRALALVAGARELPLLDAAQHVLGEDLELGRLPVEIRLVVGEVADHALQLLRALGAEAEIVVVVLEAHQVAAGEPSDQPRAQRGPLVVLEVEPEALVDEVTQQTKLLFRKIDIVIGGVVHGLLTQRPQRTRRGRRESH